MQLYIKLNEGGQAVGYPIFADNLRNALEVSDLDAATLTKFGYAKFEHRDPAPNTVVLGDPSYALEGDVWVPVFPTREMSQDEKLTKFIREPREILLLRSDWTQMPDAPLPAAKKAEWTAYRQALRDMTNEQSGIVDASEVVWPERPA